MATVLLQISKGFPRRRGLGATARHQGGQIRPGPLTTNYAPSRAITNASSATTNVGNPSQTSYGAGKWSQSRQAGGWRGNGNASGGGGGWLSQAQNPTAPTSADIQAFQAALENASALGVITTAQVAQLQAQATQSTDQQLQTFTAQINNLVASTPSAQAAAAASNSALAGAAATTSTSWWSGTTTVLGTTVSNSTLAIGAGLAAVALWAAFKKK